MKTIVIILLFVYIITITLLDFLYWQIRDIIQDTIKGEPNV